MKAHEILKQAAEILEERGKLRDNEKGERSMARAVEAFNALLPEKELTEFQGWLFLCCLKMSRATAGKPHLDDASDLCGYAALLGECLVKGEGQWGPKPEFQPCSEEYATICAAATGGGGGPYNKNDDGWIEWKGGDCPVSFSSRVDVEFRDGEVRLDKPALHWCWEHDLDENSMEIIAYRVLDQ